MLRNRRAEEQRNKMTAEMAALKKQATRLFNIVGEQTEEYKALAKELNALLIAAGLTSLTIIEG